MNQLAERLRALHHADAPLILPNAWDVASARAVDSLAWTNAALSGAAASITRTRLSWGIRGP